MDLKNGGGRDCSLAGYAGVDLKTNSGTVSAERTGESAPSVVLADGDTVTFGITYPINDSGGSGVRVTGLVVTPAGRDQVGHPRLAGRRHAARHGRLRHPGAGRPARQRRPGRLTHPTSHESSSGVPGPPRARAAPAP